MNHQQWIAKFEANRHDRPEPDWFAPMELCEAKRVPLARSLAEYQLGDGGGECRLIARDADSVRGISPDAARLIDLWFAEEREHSRLLSDGLKRLRGEFITTTFGFRLFNAVRRSFGVQFEMLVLLVVEIVSTGYYRCIQRHCDDKPIADMCGLILRDEAGHIAFHRDRLKAGPQPWSRWIWKHYFQILGFACAAFLWMGHGRWLRAVGASWRELHHEVRCGLNAFTQSLFSGWRQEAAVMREESRAGFVSD